MGNKQNNSKCKDQTYYLKNDNGIQELNFLFLSII